MNEKWREETSKTNKLALIKEWCTDYKRLRLSSTKVYKT